MKTNDSKQNQAADHVKNTSSASSKEASSKMLKPNADNKEKDKTASGDSEKFEGTLRHKEGEKDK